MRLISLLQFVVLAAAVLSCVALIVAAWVGTGALAGAAALLGVASCRTRAAAWVRAAAVRAAVRSSWSADVHVGFALLDGLDDCSLSATAGYEVELCIGMRLLFTERMIML